MKSLFNTEKNFNDLIFENRNKQYGAYELRNTQNDSISKSLGITVSAVCLLFISLYFINKKEDVTSIQADGNTPPVIIEQITEMFVKPPVEKVVPEKPKDPAPVLTQTGALEASDDHDKTFNKTNDDLNVSKVNNDKGVDSLETTEIPVEKIVVRKEPSEPELFVTEMPEFRGNLSKFIKDNIRYPEIAKENGTKGIVGLSFIIEKDGSVGEIKVLGSVPDGCTEEAIRVVKMMPNWKPGKNHGEPVRVIFNLPVKFALQ